MHGVGAGGADLVSELSEAAMLLARTIRRAGATQVEPLGITFAQARVLRALGDAGELRMVDIAHRMGVVPRSVTDLVDGLEDAGLAGRWPDPADRRSVLVELTPGGREMLARMGAARHEAAATVFGRLEESEQRQLLVLLRVVAERDIDRCGGPDGAGKDTERGKRGRGE
ncbi:MAG TPA: MarR family transcriptional regulator [Pseudonocardiaceae bacterium]|jgi:DNA-binding MarR family transcriptional regulator